MAAPGPPPPPPPPPVPGNAAPGTSRLARRGANIRGPQSALTDFLASHNIDATRIRQDADARRAAAQASRQAADASANGDDTTPPDSESGTAPRTRQSASVQTNKRKKDTAKAKAIAKIKASKRFQRSRMAAGDLSADEEAAERLAENMIIEQFDNCEICEVRFQVTAYSRTGPNGGLLCLKCTKDMDMDKGKGGPNKRRKIDARMNRRKMESDHLDGIHRRGAKNLMSLCLETVVRNAEEASDLGDLPPSLVDRLAALMSKQRLINKTTLSLFLQPGSDTVTIYDGAKLSSDDYIRIFQTCSTIKHLRIRNAIQFKSNVMEYLTNCPIKLESFSIHGANLIDDVHWDAFLIEKGKYLRALKVYYTDGHFGDTQLEMLKVVCPDLVRLKVAHNQQVTDEGLKQIASLPRLQHLSLEIYNPTHSEPYVEILKSIGPGLRTFCLSTSPNVDDTVLQAIHDSCRNLAKLRITKSEYCTDAGFAALFTNWSNPPLQDIEFGECRDCNAMETIKNEDGIGLCSAGFEALIAHSGHSIRHLNIVSCRHITREAFENAFPPKKLYPELREIDVSFCWGVDDFVVGSIFRCCPMLKTLKVFGDFGVRDVRVPRGRVLIGMPNAMGMQIEGDEKSDAEAEKD